MSRYDAYLKAGEGGFIRTFIRADRAGRERHIRELESMTRMGVGLTSIKTQLGAEGRAEALHPFAVSRAETGAESAGVDLTEKKAVLGREERSRELQRGAFGFTQEELEGLEETDQLKVALEISKLMQKKGSIQKTAATRIEEMRGRGVAAEAGIAEDEERKKSALIRGEADRAEAGLRVLETEKETRLIPGRGKAERAEDILREREARKETRLLPEREEADLASIQSEIATAEFERQLADAKVQAGLPREVADELEEISKERLNFKILEAQIKRFNATAQATKKATGAPMSAAEIDAYMAENNMSPEARPFIVLEELGLGDDVRAYVTNFQRAIMAVVGLSNQKIVPSDVYGNMFPKMSGTKIKQGMDAQDATQLLLAYASSELANLQKLSPAHWQSIMNSFNRETLELYQKMGGTIGEPLGRKTRQELIDEGRRRREQGGTTK